MKEITIKTGKGVGTTSVIFAGIHGNEICGVEAFKKIIPKINIKNGTVYFILGNPRAIQQNKRFIDHNLNRLFSIQKRYPLNIKKTYEYKRMIILKKFLNQADALLDIHSTTNKNKPFIICEKKLQKITDYLPSDFKKIVYGFDKIEPGGTDGYMLSQGKIGICVECGIHSSPKSIKTASRAIINFLKIQGHIPTKKPLLKINRKKIKIESIYYTKTDKFILTKKFVDFERINKGQVIAFDGEDKIISPKNCIILFAHNRKKIGEEGFLIGHEL